MTEVGDGAWIVDGDGKLGDAYPTYAVAKPDGTKKYECACYSHGQGQYRRAKMCSHVLAVILHSNGRKQSTPDTEPKDLNVTIQTPTVETEPVDPVKTARRGHHEAARAMRKPKGYKKEKRVEQQRQVTQLPDEAISTNDAMLGTPTLPPKFTEYRTNQWEAIVDIMEHFDAGVKVVMLSAPTGSGKTIIGESVRRFMPGKSVYCCTTKSLQDQIQREFEYARTIKGRANYPTQHRPDLTADDCTATSSNNYQCDWCDERESCPYTAAKSDAAHAPFPILNIAYFLGETTNQLSSDFRNRQLVVIDEADTLEGQLMSNIEVVIGSHLRKSLGVNTIPKKTKGKEPAVQDWVRWLEDEIVPGIRMRQAQLRQEARTLFGESIQKRRQIKRLDMLLKRIRPLLVSQDNGKRRIEDGWVMTGYEGNAKDPTIRFKPIRVDEHAKEALWSRGEQFLLMSATLISPAQMAEDLGLEDDEWAVVNLDSTFPVENRPVFVDAVTAVTNKTKDKAYPILVDAIEGIMTENEGVRILVHTVSYHLTGFLMNGIKSDRTLTYQNAQDRERVLAKFLDTDDAVLLAPSFERGIDLPEEDCQIIVIAKVPYPYLGDKQISARLYGRGGRTWYAVETIRSIVQMTGRGMRSADDWCDAYVLDASFKRLYRENKRLFPLWWRESLVVSRTDPKYRPLIEAAKGRRERR